ncbi:LacI family DNA-binding transcriptional regulator [Cohnella thailandensis]|uniref:LacI family DNA-binding transcriptional regulator n=1 Tax=Cohnella thailandensis TaxID=557557 RepID=A0A841T9R2_9BACL|nr:LacI family DNA-binding transcriptional regulator [Cohnella thailandensis]MBB6637951.1 LacI family DNA-binding transcriptional regulator [Cohnella thailandensis]MBP1976910.1 DNA-binding LacI/PurR family transcriptional regulator [Cohnella thailandensis]
MATIKDIARKAGVSVTTVSRALNGYDDVSETTRKKIKQVAEELSYSPNAVARSLVSKKTRTIGLIISDINRAGAKDAFAYEVLCGINDRAGDLNYDLLLFSTNPSKQMEKSYTALCKERNVEGAIISGLRLDDPYLQEVIDQNSFPCVLIDIPRTGDNVAYIASDSRAGAAMAVQHLLDGGHREIAMINGHNQAFVSKERLDGYKDALAKAGVPFRQELVYDGAFTEDGGAEAMYQILLRHPETTAVFCASDLMALGAMRTLERMGRRVPEDMSVVGFDDISIAAYCSPKLTTIRQDKYEMGYRGAQLLIDMLDDRTDSRKVILGNQLIVRESTAPKGNR